MPFRIVKVRGGWKVKSPSGVHSKKPLSRAKAVRQQRAIYRATGGK